MKKIICLFLIAVSILSCSFCLSACVEEGCFACGGSGYYQKKDCPFC